MTLAAVSVNVMDLWQWACILLQGVAILLLGLGSLRGGRSGPRGPAGPPGPPGPAGMAGPRGRAWYERDNAP